MLASTYFVSVAFISSLSFACGLAVQVKHVGFAADPRINAHGIFAAAKASQKAGKHILAKFPSSPDKKDNVKIFGDWEKLPGISAIHFIADMDVDCDGVDFKCPHNPDGQPQTSFGHLDARKVPFYVIPLKFYKQQKHRIRPNALGVIICNRKAFYGIFGDEDGDHPEVIGEASILMAQTCFPHEGLDGGTGHHAVDVLYVIFGDKVPRGVGNRTIDITALKELGDKELKKLAYALGV